MSESDHEPTQRLDGQAAPPNLSTALPEYLLGWDRYVLKHRLGAGGMGEVFKAWDPRLGRFVALKFLGSSDPETLERFEREARAQARIDHPAICKVFEVGEVAGHRFIAMQEIHGVTLDQIAPSLSLEQKIGLVRELAEAIHSAHRIGLIHRDLKPGNILVEQGDDGTHRPFIVDFGLARDQHSPGATISGTIAGTVGYMSPEQARGHFEEIDRRTDVYNLGVLLYEMVAGRLPFEFDNILEAIVRLQHEDAPPPRRFRRAIPPDVETIVMKALERDPTRRYDSALAMAEDLRRFLDGEPIVARRSSLVYRLRMRARKHRAIATVVSVAAVLLALAGASVLRERWNADARAELSQRFGMEIKEIELLTRIARMLPRDRAIRMRTLVLPRMERIRARMKQSGRVAEGPGSYALARGSIALGDYRGAWTHLEAAVAAGYQTADVHYARGQVLGHFYEEAISRAGSINEPELRDAARRDAARRFRTPAIQALRLAMKTADAPDLLLAQLALHEERLDEALELAHRAGAASPWLYEALMIEVTALRKKAHLQSEAGQFSAAIEGFAMASDRLKSAIAIARSDPQVHYQDCRVRNQILHAIRFQRRLTQLDGDAAVAPCAAASHLDPEMPSPWTTRGMIHTVIAEDQMRHGEDPTSQLDLAVVAMRRAGALDPSDPVAASGLGRADATRARWGIPRGVDPRPLLTRAIASLEKAVAAEPTVAAHRLSLANAFLSRGEYENRIGGDARPWLQKAIAQGRQALEPDPNLFLIHNLIGNTFNNLADREIAAGGDPSGAIAEATRSFARAVALNPSNSAVYNNQGNTWLTLAEYRSGRGESIEDAARRGIDSYRRAIALRSDYPLPWFNIGYTTRLLALDRVRRNEDPTPALREARAALARYGASSPGDIDAEVEHARVAIIEARWRLVSGRDPRSVLGNAERSARAALGIDGTAIAAHLAMAERYRWEAVWLARGGKPPAAALRRGRDALDRARHSDRENPEAKSLEGAFLLLEAGTGSSSRETQLRSRGTAMIENAIRARPSLRRDF